jgi:hypothetical protein
MLLGYFRIRGMKAATQESGIHFLLKKIEEYKNYYPPLKTIIELLPLLYLLVNEYGLAC